nr:MAG TPA: hypothetical protein [Caudoviricetes sp.]
MWSLFDELFWICFIITLLCFIFLPNPELICGV